MFNDFSKGKDSYSQKQASNKGPDKAGLIVEEILQNYIVTYGWGLSVILKSLINRRFWIAWPILLGSIFGILKFAKTGSHILWLHQIWPEVLTWNRLEFLYNYSIYHHGAVLWSLLSFAIVPCFGIYAMSIRSKYRKVFQRVGLKDGMGDTPKLVKKVKLDSFRTRLTFDPSGLGSSDFLKKKEALETILRGRIESINTNLKKGLIDVTFTTLKLPDSVHYLDIRAQLRLKEASFFLGNSGIGPQQQALRELPHMLIAGTTGSGKSVFFKQALLGILESTPHLQMYCIDLKGGLEMVDFSTAPNVRVVKIPSRSSASFSTNRKGNDGSICLFGGKQSQRSYTRKR